MEKKLTRLIVLQRPQAFGIDQKNNFELKCCFGLEKFYSNRSCGLRINFLPTRTGNGSLMHSLLFTTASYKKKRKKARLFPLTAIMVNSSYSPTSIKAQKMEPMILCCVNRTIWLPWIIISKIIISTFH